MSASERIHVTWYTNLQIETRAFVQCTLITWRTSCVSFSRPNGTQHSSYELVYFVKSRDVINCHQTALFQVCINLRKHPVFDREYKIYRDTSAFRQEPNLLSALERYPLYRECTLGESWLLICGKTATNEQSLLETINRQTLPHIIRYASWNVTRPKLIFYTRLSGCNCKILSCRQHRSEAQLPEVQPRVYRQPGIPVWLQLHHALRVQGLLQVPVLQNDDQAQEERCFDWSAEIPQRTGCSPAEQVIWMSTMTSSSAEQVIRMSTMTSSIKVSMKVYLNRQNPFPSFENQRNKVCSTFTAKHPKVLIN